MSDVLSAAKLLAPFPTGDTAFHRCTIPEEVEALVRLGLDVNAKTCADLTPLHSACGDGHLGVAEALIAAGAEVDATECEGSTPLHFACENGHLEVAQKLIAVGADVDARGSGGRTPLHYACSGGHLELAQALIAAGADLNVGDIRGMTPFAFCAADELKALFAPKGGKTLLTALKELLTQYE